MNKHIRKRPHERHVRQKYMLGYIYSYHLAINGRSYHIYIGVLRSGNVRPDGSGRNKVVIIKSASAVQRKGRIPQLEVPFIYPGYIEFQCKGHDEQGTKFPNSPTMILIKAQALVSSLIAVLRHHGCLLWSEKLCMVDRTVASSLLKDWHYMWKSLLPKLTNFNFRLGAVNPGQMWNICISINFTGGCDCAVKTLQSTISFTCLCSVLCRGEHNHDTKI